MKNIGFIFEHSFFLTTAFFVDVVYRLATQVFDKYFFQLATQYKMSDADYKNDVDAPCAKKLKISQQNENGVSDNQLELKDFLPEKILNNNTNRKTVCIQGTFKGKSGVALILFEKNAFKEEDLNDKGYFSADTELQTFFQNDIYGNYECFPRPTLNGE